ncbi:phosphotransferase enzyme family protein [Namhaeicola litoreus]|uniref:Phosphotransferase enzyme family protein n=1 Tax=Namhaeicola litoreus TaxID=1052145 RepID=A0ABW3Y2C3_9FLAO
MEKLRKILSYFDIPKGAYQFEFISNGLINDTFLVKEGCESNYILQKINTSVFKNVNGLVKNIAIILSQLDHTAYEKVHLINTKTGKPILNWENEIWRLMNYIPDSHVYNTTNDVQIAFETGKILGLFHNLVKGLHPQELEITIQNFHNLTYRYAQFLEAYENASDTHLQEAYHEIDFVKNNISTLLSIDFDKIPLRICHNDTKLNNVLFSIDKKALCLIDLDTLMPGFFLYDFGDAIRTLVNPVTEDERDLSLIMFDKMMFSSFLKGLKKSGLKFTQTERESLHFGAILMPFLHGIRALTDYLEKNKYYKVAYANQNLDRCKSLFRFAELAVENTNFMKEEIQNRFEILEN